MEDMHHAAAAAAAALAASSLHPPYTLRQLGCHSSSLFVCGSLALVWICLLQSFRAAPPLRCGFAAPSSSSPLPAPCFSRRVVCLSGSLLSRFSIRDCFLRHASLVGLHSIALSLSLSPSVSVCPSFPRSVFRVGCVLFVSHHFAISSDWPEQSYRRGAHCQLNRRSARDRCAPSSPRGTDLDPLPPPPSLASLDHSTSALFFQHSFIRSVNRPIPSELGS